MVSIVDFNFVISIKVETFAGSNFFVSFHCSAGSNSQCDSYKMQAMHLFRNNLTIYRNCNGLIWTADEIELNNFSFAATIYDDDPPEGKYINIPFGKSSESSCKYFQIVRKMQAFKAYYLEAFHTVS
jgi:hypothetical protein